MLGRKNKKGQEGSKRLVTDLNATNNNDDNSKVHDILWRIYNDVNINLDRLDHRDESISQLISNTKNNECDEIVNGMNDEIKDNLDILDYRDVNGMNDEINDNV